MLKAPGGAVGVNDRLDKCIEPPNFSTFKIN